MAPVYSRVDAPEQHVDGWMVSTIILIAAALGLSGLFAYLTVANIQWRIRCAEHREEAGEHRVRMAMTRERNFFLEREMHRITRRFHGCGTQTVDIPSIHISPEDETRAGPSTRTQIAKASPLSFKTVMSHESAIPAGLNLQRRNSMSEPSSPRRNEDSELNIPESPCHRRSRSMSAAKADLFVDADIIKQAKGKGKEGTAVPAAVPVGRAPASDRVRAPTWLLGSRSSNGLWVPSSPSVEEGPTPAVVGLAPAVSAAAPGPGPGLPRNTTVADLAALMGSSTSATERFTLSRVRSILRHDTLQSIGSVLSQSEWEDVSVEEEE